MLKKILDLAEIYNLITVISSGIEHPINTSWSNKIKGSFDIVDLTFDYYITDQDNI